MTDMNKAIIAVVIVLLTVSVLAFTIVGGSGVSGSPGTSDPLSGYNLKRPHVSIELPEILLEVSGITEIDDRTLACVQDEDGIVFIYDVEDKKIVRQLEFAGGGDYEGIARAGNSLYVLRSDGKIYEIDDYRKDDFKVTSFDTKIPVKNSEGLGLDAANNRLLIAGKVGPDDDAYRGKKVVYGFDLSTKKVADKPVLVIDEKISESGISPSAIAVHPLTDLIYVLSSKSHLLYVFNRDGEVEELHPLPKKSFAQPEGITFLKGGDMFISNEGKKDAPTLLRFDYAGGR